MLTKPRLSIFEAKTLGQQLKYAALKKAFGMLPAAVHVMSPKTKLDRSSWTGNMKTMKRLRTRWSQGEEECMASFISFLNHCRF